MDTIVEDIASKYCNIVEEVQNSSLGAKYTLCVRVEVPFIVEFSRNLCRMLSERSVLKMHPSLTVGQTISDHIRHSLTVRLQSSSTLILGDSGNRTAASAADVSDSADDDDDDNGEGKSVHDYVANVSISFPQGDFVTDFVRRIRPTFTHKRLRTDRNYNSNAITYNDVQRLYDILKRDLTVKVDPEAASCPWTSLAATINACGHGKDDGGNDSNVVPRTLVVDTSVATDTFYLFGRYNKYARDVPQSLWLIPEDTDRQEQQQQPPPPDTASGRCRSDEGPPQKRPKTDPTSGEEPIAIVTTSNTHDGVRKGRGSVHEIIADVVGAGVGTTSDYVHFHACGREDIDVRCLGNGRPFVLKVERARRFCHGSADLKKMEDMINTEAGMNGEGDIRVSCLQSCEKSVWSTMQEEAAEKRKSYTCVVVCTQAPTLSAGQSGLITGLSAPARHGSKGDQVGKAYAVSDEDLLKVESLATQGRDKDGSPCLTVQQKTPLRVLHRRSLMTRPKYIYNLRTERLAKNAFLLHVTTTAGTYVKELVHGDWGRTEPNVSSLLGCQASIIQLDVARLHDDMPSLDVDS